MTSIQYSFARCEQKYILTARQQQILSGRIRSHVRPDEYGRYSICNLYCDTDDWRLVRASLEKPLYKEKLRIRSYGVPSADGTAFVELKKKFDGVVYKRRITAELRQIGPFLAGDIPGENFGQIGREIEWFQRLYRARPRIYIGYDREAYAGIEDPGLRITFDTRLRWRATDLSLTAGDYGAPLTPDDWALMEIKLPGACPLWLSRILSEERIFPASFSKYGFCFLKNILPAQSKEERIYA